MNPMNKKYMYYCNALHGRQDCDHAKIIYNTPFISGCHRLIEYHK